MFPYIPPPSAHGPEPGWEARAAVEREQMAARWHNGPVTKWQIVGLMVTLAALFVIWKFFI
jgi:hypothetical protein